MIMIFVGIILIVSGILCLYKSMLHKEFYEKVQNGKLSEYQKTIGVVICDAYHISDVTEINKPVTPIVEYEVKGEKYEAQNPTLETGAELPVGTKVYVWYKKDNPKISILGTELDSYFSKKLSGFVLIAFGLIFVLLNF